MMLGGGDTFDLGKNEAEGPKESEVDIEDRDVDSPVL